MKIHSYKFVSARKDSGNGFHAAVLSDVETAENRRAQDSGCTRGEARSPFLSYRGESGLPWMVRSSIAVV